MTPEEILASHLSITQERARYLLDDLEKISWVYSSSPIKRAFGIWGNAIAAYMMVVLPFICLGLLSSLF